MFIHREQVAGSDVVHPRYFLHISYDGTNYSGWQLQPNGNTVQAEVESALRKLLKQKTVVTTGCGRTDAGVHARNFFLHFDATQEIEDIPTLFFRLNQLLPWDIGVNGIVRVADRAHARFDATERTYEYHVHQRRDPFIHTYSKYFPFPLDVEKMKEAAAMLVNYSDFASFQRTGGGQRTSICHLKRAEWQQNGHRLVFTITADRFLRNMVRAIVGTHFDIGRGRMTLNEYVEAIEGKNRTLAGDSIAPQGLHLVDIKYPYPVEQIIG
ncbi:MAG: tRNA pseudouridine(38-40) synthase TruA [Flavobacteriales bacterium]|nr:tRNA pseudouridine(38-40) synthase TruA [Flavobacteriales bacterium]